MLGALDEEHLGGGGRVVQHDGDRGLVRDRLGDQARGVRRERAADVGERRRG
jgi:hypothetical protein